MEQVPGPEAPRGAIPTAPARDTALAQARRSVRSLGDLLVVALVLHTIIHYVGLLASVAGVGKSAHWVREQAATGAPPEISNYGEIQPLGRLEDAIPVVVTALLVMFLVAMVRRIRLERGDGEEGRLPPTQRLVALFALLRPRRVVEWIWRRTEPGSGAGVVTRRRLGAPLLDVLWATWLLTNVTIRLGDSMGESARTIRQARASYMVETAAEAGFVLTGLLLLWLTISIRRRANGSGSPAAAALVAVPLLALAAIPLPAIHDRAAAGPSVADMRLQVEVERAWDRREAAAAARDEDALRRASTGTALALDLAAARRQRESGRRTRWARSLDGVKPLGAAPGARRMLATVNTHGGPGWDGDTGADLEIVLVMLERANASAPWSIALEVPFRRWGRDWPGDFALDPRRRPDPFARDAIKATARPGDRIRTASFALVEGRTITCASRTSYRGSVGLVCMLLDPASGPTRLGSDAIWSDAGRRGQAA